VLPIHWWPRRQWMYALDMDTICLTETNPPKEASDDQD
jgi:hypothetical protein